MLFRLVLAECRFWFKFQNPFFVFCLHLETVATISLSSGMVSPLTFGGVMICSKCPLIIPGRCYRVQGGGFLSSIRSEGIRRERKQIIEPTTSLQAPVKHRV